MYYYYNKSDNDDYYYYYYYYYYIILQRVSLSGKDLERMARVREFFE